ncbi:MULTISPECIES: cupin domain-containing protein [unclassified Brevibacterium]|uniref:cupin domain-containing protein n=1 Tax=unclassified Brevibacterium TaxID=2614124 RepID=UPI0010F70C45|nr:MULTISPECIES: cupin domain-containing protein [unclassified Brevibacterium]MCM1012988.1 cupin domain-containing protein [Brevibacterium sp. XM4083]
MSTPTTEIQHPGAAAGAGVLESRLIDCSRGTFAQDYWGRRALLSRGVSDFSDLFSSRAVDELISARGLRSPFLRVAKDGATLPTASFTSPAGVGATIGDQLDDTKLWKQFHAGATLVLQALQRTWEPIGAFSSALSRELGNPVQANAYITPPQNQGFDDHYDVHDVFVLQIEGAKRWVIHEPVFDAPLRDQPWTDRREAVGRAATTEPVIDAVLEPGDALYLPRGWLHAATAQGDVSIHLTLGIHNWTRYGVAEQLAQAALARLQDDPQMRASLPLGQSRPDAETLEAIREAMVSALTAADPNPSIDRISRSQARPAPLGPLAQHAAMKHLDDASPLTLRAGLDATLEGNRLRTRIGWFDFTDAELPDVRTLLDGDPVSVADIGRPLAERLLAAGALVPALG